MVRYHVGIDPDNDKSGVAVWDKLENKFILITSIEFWSLVKFLEIGYHKFIKIDDWNVCNINVVIEAGWLNKKSNFHKAQGPAVPEKIAKNVGMNQQIGKLFVSYCERTGLKHEIVKPIGTKTFDAKLFKQLTKWEGQTNQDSRDAALLVFKK